MTSHAGRFIWRELVTPNRDAARAFYATLAGWSASEQDMGAGAPYLMFGHPSLDESVGGAMQPMMDGVPPHWLDYITVDDVDASLEQVVALGGEKVTDPMDIPVGRFAIVRDPAGATFALFRGTDPGATDTTRKPPVGTFCWSQLMTRDLAQTVPFYSAVFGWTAQEMPGGMVVFMRGEQPVASALRMPDDAPAPNHWLPYIAVDDTDASTAVADQAGATIVHQPETLPGMGRFSVMMDPSGATVALWKDLGASA